MRNVIIQLFDEKLWKFLLVGIINTLIGATVMFSCYNLLHFSYWISSAANYVVGSIVSYFLNKNFTFHNKSNSWKTVIKFVINIFVCYLLAYGVAKPLTAYLLSSVSINVKENVAMLVGMCLFVGLNYLGQRFFAFSSNTEEEV